jgi:hypothetical protein
MMELAQQHEKILGEADFVLVAADGWSHGGSVHPQVDVTRHKKSPGGGGHGGYGLLVDANQVIHFRTYAGRNHAAAVVIRQEYESKHKTLTVEMSFIDPGAPRPAGPIQLEVWEEFKVETQ